MPFNCFIYILCISYSNDYSFLVYKITGRDRIDEVEPEWFSGGPTSQSETIELVGFEEQNDDDNRKSKKNSKKAKQNSRRSSLKSEEGEKIENAVTEEQPSQKKGIGKLSNFIFNILLQMSFIFCIKLLIIISVEKLKVFLLIIFSFCIFSFCVYHFYSHFYFVSAFFLKTPDFELGKNVIRISPLTL